MQGEKPLIGPICLEICFLIPMPDSWPKKKKDGMNGKRHTSKPDTSNLIKYAEDALNGIAYNDDCQICCIKADKYWGFAGSTLIRVKSIDDYGM
jgi:Holliday junction resolvase RusA-like endonuclease